MALRKLSKYLRSQGNGTSASHLGRGNSSPNGKVQRPQRKQNPEDHNQLVFGFSGNSRVFCSEEDTFKTPQKRVLWHSLLLDEAAYNLSRRPLRREVVTRQETSGEQTKNTVSESLFARDKCRKQCFL
jgi:hypothetical protein